MILHHSTVYIRKDDKDINGDMHIDNGLIVVEIDGTPTMEDIRDFITERWVGGQVLTMRNCNFMTAHDWSTMMAAEIILQAMEISKEGWVDDTVTPTPKLTTNLEKETWWTKFWAKGLKK